ncbi:MULTISPECIES: MBL fold metallo-hydrolase [unclassified Paenibacillus]|uniref:MBL fold metallo-hydrolase n=1 Tax=unclassified Paenibacillus TaxID=185978 RepID=UPI00095674A8|nr:MULTISPECIES: MBL fold metallo-hydrolase [unclassified Paenibacillus]ASS64814.1 MBL fold metallo-hydrolase [Paenibacillus sp. RUD330]SIR05127.1 Glyoxylase, beta-lactamase superfamily II [Paenibacillus sp. RU4X]SIR30220.1 Glyoxylase, beta-lactamase superfamily II [Paenibacillus sp. RU4T]
MNVKQVSEHIWSLKAWMVIPFHVWAVVGKDGVTLVDAGVPWMAKNISRLLDRLQAGPLQQIVLTHGHSDHVGSLKKLLEARQVPVYAHDREIPYAEGRTPYPKKDKASASVPKGTLTALAEEASGGLAPIGGLKPYFTPGHSPGHVVYYHEGDDVLLAGDLFNSRKGKVLKARFTPYPEEAMVSSAIIKELRPAKLEVCHGDAVLQPADQWDDLMRQYAGNNN